VRNKKGRRSRGTGLWVADGPAGIFVLHDLFSSSGSAMHLFLNGDLRALCGHRTAKLFLNKCYGGDGKGANKKSPPSQGRRAWADLRGATLVEGKDCSSQPLGRDNGRKSLPASIHGGSPGGSPAMLTGEFGPAGRAGTPRGHWWWACTRWSHLAAGMAYCSCSTHGIWLVSWAHRVGLRPGDRWRQ